MIERHPIASYAHGCYVTSMSKKELHRYGIKADDECLYCGEKDSIDHTFLNCRFVKIIVNNVIDWFNAANNSKFAPTIEEKLFGIISGPYEKEILRKFNYTILFMKYYIYRPVRCIAKVFAFLFLLTKFYLNTE